MQSHKNIKKIYIAPLNRRVRGSSPRQSTNLDHHGLFLLPRALQRLINLCPCSAWRTPDKSRSQTFSLSHSAFACLPACASYTVPPAVHQTRPSWSFFIAEDFTKIDKSLPMFHMANPGQVQVTNFQFEPFGICLPPSMCLIQPFFTSFCLLKLILNFVYVGIFYFKNIIKNIKFVKFMNYNYNSLFFLQ